jgi:hypothetical protein
MRSLCFKVLVDMETEDIRNDLLRIGKVQQRYSIVLDLNGLLIHKFAQGKAHKMRHGCTAFLDWIHQKEDIIFSC